LLRFGSGIAMKGKFFMNKISATLLGVIILSATVSSAVTPALALGGCGPNYHVSSVTGRCVWGGQNEGWCLKHTGRPAVRMPDGSLRCVR
jgi:hypothetical protein